MVSPCAWASAWGAPPLCGGFCLAVAWLEGTRLLSQLVEPSRVTLQRGPGQARPVKVLLAERGPSSTFGDLAASPLPVLTLLGALRA